MGTQKNRLIEIVPLSIQSMLQLMGKKIFTFFMLKNFVYLNLSMFVRLNLKLRSHCSGCFNPLLHNNTF